MSNLPNLSEPALKPPIARGKMLPGVAGIAMFLLFLTLVNVFAALQNAFGAGAGKYGVLAICTMLGVGLFGLLRMRRFGWAMVAGACVVLTAGYFYGFRLTHSPGFLIQGLLVLVFFLYLIRPDVRDRML
jgi:hypothetical protein